jgi:SRSO17 transposase
LPAIAKAVGLENGQSLHHFISQSPWQAKDLEKRRLEIILNITLANYLLKVGRAA